MAKVSVIIPCYNARPFLKQCIESVLGQSFRDFEIIVVDDGSNDGSREELDSFGSDIRLFSQVRKGVSKARNHGISQALGDFIAFLDADDYWSEQYLEYQVSRLEKESGSGWSHTLSWEVTSSGEPVRVTGWGRLRADSDQDFAEGLMLTNSPGTSAVMVRRACLITVGGFDKALRCGEDWDLWIRLAFHTPAVGIPEPLTCFRQRSGSNLPTMLERGADWALPYIVRKNLPFISGPEHSELRTLALLRALLFGVWLQSMSGNSTAARRLVEEIDSELGAKWRELEVCPSWIAEFTDQLKSFGPDLDEALCSIDSVVSVLGSDLSGSRFHRMAIGHYFGIRLFRESEGGNRKEILRAALPAIKFRPAWLKNSGFRAILGRTILGLKPMRDRCLARRPG